MAQFGKATFADFKKVQDVITGKLTGTKSFEEACQHYTTSIYTQFKESIVLIRQFVTIPYKDLPESNKQYVSALSASKGVKDLLTPGTLVLSLAGSSGVEPAWNDRKASRGTCGGSSDFSRVY